MTAFDAASVAEALAGVRARIVAAGGGDDVAILAVTKGFGPEAIDAARAAGCTAVGENYAQELLDKREACAGLVTLYETVDRPRLAREIAKRDPGASVLVQVDTTGESGKGGCPIAGLDDLVGLVRELGLGLRGLMTVGPTAGTVEDARDGFRAVRAAVDRYGLSICSMGMTADLEVAVQEGSTEVRVGTALFGPRSVPTRREQAR